MDQIKPKIEGPDIIFCLLSFAIPAKMIGKLCSNRCYYLFFKYNT